MRLNIVFIVVIGVLPLIANGDCTIEPARMNYLLSADALAKRNKLFLQQCGDGDKGLVDVTDPTLVGRLDLPRKPHIPIPFDLNPERQQGTLLLAFVVEIDGAVHQVAVLESSGKKALDAAALDVWKHGKFESPARLDGRPIRALSYFKFTLRGPGGR